MNPKTKLNPRDPAKPVSSYQDVISESQTEIDRLLKNNLAPTLMMAPRLALSIAMAHYSAGDSVKECVRWLGQAAAYKTLHFEKMNYSMGGYGTLIENLELLAAASIAGKGEELVDTYRRVQTKSPAAGYGLLFHAFSVFKGEPVKQVKAEMDALKKHGKDLITLAPLFKSVSDRDEAAFTKALEDFLALSWAKEVKGSEKYPEYSGKWSILSAAVSKLMGGVPKLSEKARIYVPADLVTG